MVAADEDTDEPVPVYFTVDFINPGNVYLNVGSGPGVKSYAITDYDSRKIAEFILKETRVQ